MGEDDVKREGQPMPSDLFPVGEKSALVAFNSLFPQNSSGERSASAEEVEKEKGILKKTNPVVLSSFNELLDSYPKDKAIETLLGVLIYHRALREKVENKGGQLPSFTPKFVRSYVRKQEATIKRIKVPVKHEELDSNIDPYSPIGLQIRVDNLADFRGSEQEFSGLVERELGSQPGWLPEDDYIYKGIIQAHLIFREGCVKTPKALSSKQ